MAGDSCLQDSFWSPEGGERCVNRIMLKEIQIESRSISGGWWQSGQPVRFLLTEILAGDQSKVPTNQNCETKTSNTETVFHYDL
jgi:hypothetical protein